MPIKAKYVGPLDIKVFRDYTFQRCVTDDASNPESAIPTPGEMAVELPDAIANEALKHREVFLPWNAKVPASVKALRLKRTDALRAEGEQGVENWLKYVVVAEMLPEDSPRKAAIRENEIKGAKAQVDFNRNKIVRATIERAAILREIYGENVPAELQWTDAGAAASAALVEQYKEALENEKTEKQALRAELEALKAQLERDGRLTPEEEPQAPSVGEYGIDARVTETAETPEDFPDVFGGPAAPAPAPSASTGTALESLGLAARIVTALSYGGYKTAEEVAAKTADELTALPNFGDTSVKAVRDALAKLGLKLAGE